MVIPVLTQHYAMLQRNLLYTGVTRGKRLVVLVGQKKAIAIAVTRFGPAALVEARRVAPGRGVPHVIRCVESGPRPTLTTKRRRQRYVKRRAQYSSRPTGARFRRVNPSINEGTARELAAELHDIIACVQRHCAAQSRPYPAFQRR